MRHTKTTVLIGIGLAIGLAAGPAAVAVATPLDGIGNGSGAGGVVIADAGAGANGETTGATARNDGGGGSFWQWGVSGGDTWSNYFREKRCHGATAVGKKTKRVSKVSGGKYAYAATPKASSGNKAYYHNC